MLGSAQVPRPPPVVLLVDPDQDSRLMYRCWLQDCNGLVVREAGSVSDALRVIGDHCPDVIATELAFPGEDANELCRRVRGNVVTRAALLIALTASVTPAHVQRAYFAGCDIVLAKPCLPSTLLEAIRELLPPSRPPE